MNPVERFAARLQKFTIPSFGELAGLVRWPGAMRAVELLAFAWTLPILGRLFFPDNPLGAASPFPWVVIGPAALAARYGVTQGLGCAALAVLMFTIVTGGVPVALSVGAVVLTIVVGDIATAWRRRSLQAEAENDYLKHRLKVFSSDYHVLKLSHGQLESFMAGQRLSLRQALERLRPALATRDASSASGEEIMAVFAQFCSVQVAGLYVVKNDSVIDTTPLAQLGEMGDVPQFDRLLRLAMSERRLVSVKLEAQAENHHKDGLLAVVPIVDSVDQLHAVLAIRDMHFMAFQQENLDTLALLASYIGNRIADGGALDQSPADHFLSELDTSLQFARSSAVDASLLVLRTDPGGVSDHLAQVLRDNVRSLDCSWQVPLVTGGEDHQAVVVLLPLTGRAGASAWLARQQDMFAAVGLDLQKVVHSVRCLPLDASHTRRHCLAFINGDGGELEQPGDGYRAA